MRLSVIIQIFILEYFALKKTSTQSLTPNKSICGPETELTLTETGLGSSLTLSLTPDLGHSSSTCKLRVTAPENYIVHVNIIEDDNDISTVTERSSESTCILSVYLPENRRTAIWRSDPCTQDILPDGGLLTHQLRVVWNVPNSETHARGRKLIITALAQGEACQGETQHTCLRVGWSPMMCISQELICDGIPHCPSGSVSDEDTTLCKDKKLLQQASWEKIAEELFKKLTSKNRQGTLIPAIQTEDVHNWLYGKDQQSTTERISGVRDYKNDSSPPNINSLGTALSQYGPWGYLMLGMLICGTILMFCGLWECCCRPSKPRPPTSNPGSSSPQTTVLIISPQEMEENQSPPNYEDLDQPPSYRELFPKTRPACD